MRTDTAPSISRAGLSAEEGRRAARAARLHDARDVEGLIAMLDDPSWKVRRRVVEFLAAEGAPAVEPLCDLLRTRRDNEARLAAAVDVLSASVTSDDTPIWRLAKYRSTPVVADAAQILGRRRQSDSVPLLVLLMASKDDNVAVTAIEALGRIGGRAAVDALLECLHSDNFFRVFPTIELLGRSGDPRAVRPLTDLLERPQYTREAARALGRTGDLGAVPALARLLNDSHDSTVRLAAQSLAELDVRYRERYGGADGIESALSHAGSMEEAGARLCRALAGADAKEQAAIAAVLSALGEQDAVPHLSRLLDGPTEVAAAAAAALEHIGKRAEEEMRRVLRDGTSSEREAVLPFCAKRNAVPAILQCLSDEEPSVRALAAETLGRIGEPAVVRHLFPLLADADIRVAQSVTSAIQSLGSDEARALAMDSARSDSPVMRRAALRILAYFGGSSAFDVFAAATGDSDARVRDVAIQGLAFVDDPRALEKLLQASRDPNEKVRAVSVRALGQCAPDARAARALVDGLRDSDAWVRYYACQALGRLREEGACSPIAELLADSAGQVRVAAVEALSHLRTDIAFGALREAAQSSEQDVQRAALIGLGLAKRAESLPLLLDALDHGEAATRLVAVSALAAFPDREVIPAWTRAAWDPDPAVRNAAVANLAKREGSEATGALVGLLASSKSDTANVLSALSIPVNGRVATILASLRQADEELSPKLTSVLARMRRPEASDALLQAFQSSNAACRRAAATALAAVGSHDGIRAIRQAAFHDADPQLKQICSLLLAR
ncbi:MAG TPA: HEAT repeat domain-containing protein [Polyangiaceae bacterium]|nr:HEAT repeat domain-containing protein [Polyangiaceae bacterium]